DLKGDPEGEPVAAEPGIAAGPEQAGGLEELPGLQRAAGQVVVDRGVRVAALAALHRLATREGETRVGEQGNRAGVGGVTELGKRAGEQVVAGGERVHAAVPVWRATIEPPRSLNRTSAKPVRASRVASSSAGGKRRTDAGR